MLKNISRKAKLIWGGVIALVVIGILGNAIGGGDPAPEAAPTATTAKTEAVKPVATNPASAATSVAPAPSAKSAAPAGDSAVYAQRIQPS